MWKLVVLAAAVSAAPSIASPGVDPHAIEDVGWLAGCWTSTRGERTIEEQWMAPAGGTMLGMNRTVARGRTVASEFLELREEGDDVFYIARPSGQAETRFRLTEAAPGRAVFENRAHDFPQVIRYTLDGDALVARIEGPGEGGRTRTIDFPMQRGVCP